MKQYAPRTSSFRLFYRLKETTPSLFHTFAPVKILSFILSFYILFSAVVPCSVFDNCEQEIHASASSDTTPSKSCNACSPFCICSAHGFAVMNNDPTIGQEPVDRLTSYCEFYASFLPGYSSRLFQPPRLG